VDAEMSENIYKKEGNPDNDSYKKDVHWKGTFSSRKKWLFSWNYIFFAFTFLLEFQSWWGNVVVV
jgi:hypothetical protein